MTGAIEPKYAVNDYVRYGKDGICLITDIAAIKSQKDGLSAQYYVLRPTADSGATIYVPLGRRELTDKMLPLPQRAEIDQSILASKSNEIPWIYDRKERNEAFQKILKRYDQAELLRLIVCIDLKKQEFLASNKKLSSADEVILKCAERLIANEFSFLLDLPDPDEVNAYIRRLLERSGA